jgi:hypothetical protein
MITRALIAAHLEEMDRLYPPLSLIAWEVGLEIANDVVARRLFRELTSALLACHLSYVRGSLPRAGRDDSMDYKVGKGHWRKVTGGLTRVSEMFADERIGDKAVFRRAGRQMKTILDKHLPAAKLHFGKIKAV